MAYFADMKEQDTDDPKKLQERHDNHGEGGRYIRFNDWLVLRRSEVAGFEAPSDKIGAAPLVEVIGNGKRRR